jgi:glyoxylase-like metal-dependent hydrolase (beta-lactamase superfamily II)
VRGGLALYLFDSGTLGLGELELFADGTIRLLETPGHSAGHMSLLLELEETGPVLLTADAAENRAQWEGRERSAGTRREVRSG